MINKHGYKMGNLRKAAGATKQAIRRRLWVQIVYSRATGEIITSEYTSPNNYAIWQDTSVIHIVTVDYPLSMQAIADAIASTVHYRNNDMDGGRE